MGKLTVKELINKLSEFNPDAEIHFLYNYIPHPLFIYGWSNGDEGDSDNPDVNTKKLATNFFFTSDINSDLNDKDR